MSNELVDRIATAVLYEGYLLYPYRASSVKNRQRFNFGVLVPEDDSMAQAGNEAWIMQAECLVAGEDPALRVSTRFLHLLHRQIFDFSVNSTSATEQLTGRPVEFLDVDGQLYQTWQEAVERKVAANSWSLSQLIESPRSVGFIFGPEQSTAAIHDTDGNRVGDIIRSQQQVRGSLSIQAVPLAQQLFRVRITIRNVTSLPSAASLTRTEVLSYSLVSAHAVLNIEQGEFISLLEPPEELSTYAAACQQVGCWPVLVGEPGDHRTLLASPIILYDYPEVAPESPGNFFDGAEIDEMLMLRVMTMTPEEQREMHALDDQARQLLARTQAFPPQDLVKLHGTTRQLYTNSSPAPLHRK